MKRRPQPVDLTQQGNQTTPIASYISTVPVDHALAWIIIHEQGTHPVILSAAKNLGCWAATEILRCAQDDACE